MRTLLLSFLFALANARAAGASDTVEILDEHVAEALPAACRERVPRVIAENQRLLDASDAEYCIGIVDAGRRSNCLAEVAAVAHARPSGAPTIFQAGEASEAGRDWPNRDRASRFVSIEARVPIEKAGRTTEHEISFLCFSSETPAGPETCVFPASHWFWSGLELPDRFAAPPRGVCGDRILSFTEYLREAPPPAETLWAIRFLSRAEAEAWRSGDPERIQFRGSYTRDHPYAKFFLLGSLLWWRGTDPSAPRPDYAYAVKVPRLPLDEVLRLERSGHAFLNLYEGGQAIELTLVDRPAVVAALGWSPEILEDTSMAGASGPAFRPYGSQNGSGPVEPSTGPAAEPVSRPAVSR